jgi:hypothetical protein
MCGFLRGKQQHSEERCRLLESHSRAWLPLMAHDAVALMARAGNRRFLHCATSWDWLQ